jgi:hypothetical protein
MRRKVLESDPIYQLGEGSEEEEEEGNGVQNKVREARYIGWCIILRRTSSDEV